MPGCAFGLPSFDSIGFVPFHQCKSIFTSTNTSTESQSSGVLAFHKVTTWADTSLHLTLAVAIPDWTMTSIFI